MQLTYEEKKTMVYWLTNSLNFHAITQEVVIATTYTFLQNTNSKLSNLDYDDVQSLESEMGDILDDVESFFKALCTYVYHVLPVIELSKDLRKGLEEFELFVFELWKEYASLPVR